MVKVHRVNQLVDRVVIRQNFRNVTNDFRFYNDKLVDYLANSKASSTENSYFLAFKRFSQFCFENNQVCLPSNPEVIATYFIKVCEEANSENPALLARSAIRHYNLQRYPDIPSPTDRADICMLIQSLTRRFGKPVVKRQPTTIDILCSLIDYFLKSDHMKVSNFSVPLTDWQIVVKSIVKFHTFSRFEEVIELKKSHFKFEENGDIEVTLPKSKNNQFHDARKSYIAKGEGRYCPSNIIKKYLFLLSHTNGDFYFIPKIKKGKVLLFEKATYSYCSKQFKMAIAAIGEDPKKFGEHSDKIGGLSTAANAGVSIEQLQRHGRWKSDHMVKIYHQRSVDLRRQVSSVLNNVKRSSLKRL